MADICVASAVSDAQALNQGCTCRSLNQQRLREQLECEVSLLGLAEHISETRPTLFSATVVFVSPQVQQEITNTVTAIERVAALSAYQQHALAKADPIARHNFGPLSACMGYDFHTSEQGVKLIEVNTNAGGLLLNAALAHAQEATCEDLRQALTRPPRPDPLRTSVFEMFAAEWRLQRGSTPWRSVAIVDSQPQGQYLAPEFELFRQLFTEHGLHAVVCDPAELSWQGGQLWHADRVVDMVYNRLTDFYLSEAAHAHLRLAYEAAAVVLTPHPRAHALLADKRQLISFKDGAKLRTWGASEADIATLEQHIPSTCEVTADNAEALWAQRRSLFFKPVAGYGGKAAYRGDKLTRGVWSHIQQGGFVAQTLVPPGSRSVEVDGQTTDLKFDIRAYTYAGQVQLLSARIYSGQTTNFRTSGGGFAPVVVLADKPQTVEAC